MSETAVLQRRAEAHVLTLHGEIDLQTVDGYADEIRSAMIALPPPGLLVVDLSELTFLAVVGIRALSDLAVASHDRDVRLRVVTTQPVTLSLLRLCDGTPPVLPPYARVADACDPGRTP
jgi:anti-anti-sigma factor